jgi:nicotinate-nucleotide adenylyltransferase
MLNLLIGDIQTPRDNIQLRRELSDQRSLISVEKAQAIWGEQEEYTLVIGSDLAGQIRHWYRSRELLEKVKILVIPRPGYPINQDDIEQLEKLGGDCLIADVFAPAVSSTDYREKGDKQAVPAPIKDYIEGQKLYA